MIEPMEKMPPEECAICHRWAESCICPECPKCGSQGDPKCYGTHFPLPTPESEGMDLEAIEKKWDGSMQEDPLSGRVLLAGQFIPTLIAEIRRLRAGAEGGE